MTLESCLVSLLLMKLVYADFQLKILHTNDIHARFDPVNKWHSDCATDGSEECYGGSPRRVTYVKEQRAANPDRTILLSAGDQFMGSFWFTVFKGDVTAFTMNQMGYDAMGLGNHEFDGGSWDLENFLENVTFPVLASNLECEPSVEEEHPYLYNLVKNYTILEIDGERIGIIGYVTEATITISMPPDGVSFDDVETTIRECIEELTALGVNKIIALGHHGYQNDIALANAVSGIDVIVGGHTDTFLFNGDPVEATNNSGARPSEAVGPYPTMNDAGTTCIVQDYTFGVWIGNLDVKWDDDGNIISCSGNPDLITEKYEEDETTKEWLEAKRSLLNERANIPMGYSMNYLEVSKDTVRRQENALANWLLDSVLEYSMMNQLLDEGGSMSYQDYPAKIAFTNGGGIRDSLSVGEITYANIKSILPFGNSFTFLNISGDVLTKVFEHSVTAASKIPSDSDGHFLQVSGVQYEFDIGLEREDPNRLLSLQVACQDSTMIEWCNVNADEFYLVVTNDYISAGGDGYSMLGELYDEGYEDPFGTPILSDMDMLTYALGSTMRAGLDRRIKVLDSTTSEGLAQMCEQYDVCMSMSDSDSGSDTEIYLITIIVLALICLLQCILVYRYYSFQQRAKVLLSSSNL